MADGDVAKPAAVGWLFIVDLTGAPDALVRVLSVCAARQVALSAVSYAAAAVRIEAAGLSERDAQQLSARLQAEPVVTGVTLGWRLKA